MRVSHNYLQFPCHGITPSGKCTCGRPEGENCKPGKHPAISGWTKPENCTRDEKKVTAWRKDGKNIGFLCGSESDLLVVDQESDGEASIAELERLVERRTGVEKKFPRETRRVRTGGGGFHYYFKHPKGMQLTNRVKFLPGLDIRTKGGLVIAPGSLHESGRRYEWDNELDTVDLDPDFIFEISLLQAQKIREKNEREKPEGPSPDADKIPNGARNATLFQIGCGLRAKGFQEVEILAALLAVNENRCVPPKSKAEVELVASQCAKYKPGEARQEAEKKKWPKAVVSSSPEFVEREFKAPETLLRVTKTGEPVLQHPSLGEVHGWRGTGKTNFLVGLLRCLALDEDWLAYSCGRESGFKTLYVDGELPAADLQELIDLVGCEHGNFSVITGEEQPDGIPSIATAEGQQWLEDAIVEGGFEIVVLDSWSTLGNVPTNDEEFTIPFAAWLKKMRLRGATVMFGHHDGKGGTQRGHSRIEDFLNWVIQLKWVGEYQGSDGLKCRMKFDKARKPVKGGYSDLVVELVDDGSGGVKWVWNFYRKEDAEKDKNRGGRKPKMFSDAEEKKIEEIFARTKSWRAVASELGVSRTRIDSWRNQKQAKPEPPKQREMYDREHKSQGEESNGPQDM